MTHSLFAGLPVHERERNLGVVMWLEHRGHRRADSHELTRIADQVAEHADAPGLRQFHEHHDVRAVLLEGGMHGVPRALPAVDDAAAVHALPAHLEGEARVADPLGTPLPGAALSAALDDQLAARSEERA